MIIVTNRCFIIADSIHYMSLDEGREEVRRNGKLVYVNIYTLTVRYTPVPNANSRRDVEACEVKFYTEKKAHDIFAEVVKQYREQNPDALYLDKIINEKLLNG